MKSNRHLLLRRPAFPRAVTCFRLLLALGLPCIRAVSIQAADQSYAGIIEPFHDVTLSASVPGIITTRKCEEGAFVDAGAVLIELDSRLEQLEVERRKLVRDQKWSDFDATQKLFKATKGVSKEEVEKKEAEYKIAAVEHDMAIEQERRRRMIAPLSGTITEIMLEVGEACQPYQPLLRLVDTRRCYLVTHVEAKQGSRLKPEQRVTLEIDLGDVKATVPGTIVFISPLVDPGSGLQKIKILFENKDGKVRPGLTGIIRSETQD